MNPIPKDIVRQICEDIREMKSKKLFNQCWGCIRASKGNPEKMCFTSRLTNEAAAW